MKVVVTVESPTKMRIVETDVKTGKVVTTKRELVDDKMIDVIIY